MRRSRSDVIDTDLNVCLVCDKVRMNALMATDRVMDGWVTPRCGEWISEHIMFINSMVPTKITVCPECRDEVTFGQVWLMAADKIKGDLD